MNTNYKMNFGKKEKIIAGLGAICLTAGLVYAGLQSVNKWFDTHTIQFNRAVNVEFKSPIEIKERKVSQTEIIKIVEEIPEYDKLETDIQKYICDKFGAYDCKVALSIVKGESNFNEEAIHVNSNGTVDLGCWQINSIHIKSGSITAKDALDCKKATDWAYNKYKKDGNFSAWVVFNNGNFKDNL